VGGEGGAGGGLVVSRESREVTSQGAGPKESRCRFRWFSPDPERSVDVKKEAPES
jgi:hypothetical protein